MKKARLFQKYGTRINEPDLYTEKGLSLISYGISEKDNRFRALFITSKDDSKRFNDITSSKVHEVTKKQEDNKLITKIWTKNSLYVIEEIEE